MGMMAGAVVFPLTVTWMTYFDKYDDKFSTWFNPSTDSKFSAASNEDVDVSVELVKAPQLGGPFTMVDAATGKTVNEKDVLLGKWTLLYFGFSKCAEICPNTLTFIGRVVDAAQQQYGVRSAAETDVLQTCFVSIDPVRDDAATLDKWLNAFRKPNPSVTKADRRIVGLVGSDEQISHIAKQWRVYFSSLSETDEEAAAREAKGQGSLRDAIKADDTYQFDHSAATYLIGPDGKLRDFYFREMGVEHAVDKMGLHFEDAYDMGNVKALKAQQRR